MAGDRALLRDAQGRPSTPLGAAVDVASADHSVQVSHFSRGGVTHRNVAPPNIAQKEHHHETVRCFPAKVHEG
jgi:hypothetical protein